jgi:hypothetical protein
MRWICQLSVREAPRNRLQNVSKTEVDSGGLKRIGEDELSVANSSSVSRLGTKTARHHQLRETRLNGFESLPHRQPSLALARNER